MFCLFSPSLPLHPLPFAPPGGGTLSSDVHVCLLPLFVPCRLPHQVADEVFQIAGRDPLIDVAMALEKAARSDDFFISRSLYPNVDF